jgi:hypothetical protein
MSNKQKILLGILAAITSVTYAAPPPPPGTGPACWPPPCVPIDGGITLLMAAGAAYSVKKFYESRKKEESVD